MKPMCSVSADIYVEVNQVEHRGSGFRIWPRRRKTASAPKTQVAWLLFSFLVRPVPYCKATSIVAIRTPDFIIVGADSAGTFEGQGEPSHVKPVCKIYQKGKMFFAVAGLVNDPVTGFNVPGIVEKASKASGTISSQARISASLVGELIPSEMASIKTRDPGKYKRIVVGKDWLSSVLFFGFENGVLVATGFGFSAVRSRSPLQFTPTWISCPGDCPHGVEVFYFSNAIRQYLALSKLTITAGNAETIVRSLIGLDMSERPKEVGPPIDVIWVDANGARWIRKKSECPEIRK